MSLVYHVEPKRHLIVRLMCPIRHTPEFLSQVHFLSCNGIFFNCQMQEKMEITVGPCSFPLLHCGVVLNRASESVVFNSGQKRALRAVNVVICQSFCQSSCEVKRSQRHLLTAIENNQLGGPIHHKNKSKSMSYDELLSILQWANETTYSKERFHGCSNY